MARRGLPLEIREIDGAADEVRAELGRTIADRHLAGQRLAKLADLEFWARPG